ncbi:hypothetical protein LCGC14_2969530, partial [marine sediment metagenome]
MEQLELRRFTGVHPICGTTELVVKLIILVFTLGIKGAFEVHQFEREEYCRYYAEIMIEQHQIKLPTQVFCC